MKKQKDTKATSEIECAENEARRKFPRAALVNNRSSAIKLMCVACVGCDAGFQSMIRECTSTVCPLFKHRPYKDDREPSGVTPDEVLAELADQKGGNRGNPVWLKKTPEMDDLLGMLNEPQ